ncbi:FAD-linked oxidoreductase [Paractinoplanes abujensis]|uniref:L-gulonolactone oxidase n=1 Tax=Paractinoplanes abujensis TaxID=882441 RepID=A0A7W7CW70_9ACTN|nr:D-arabinono-1,4-lactone oxidase [Actinoplanes abujensis]MBB4695777.1 L-gulonolactone oxidase [Actinoplanes abujensis]GID23362.1 FAD-linked oxidoreductase [Actinoplanes abujensis]
MTTPRNARRWINWGGNQQSLAVDVLTPGTVDEVVGHVKEASETGRRVKVVGSGHSFTDIAVANDQRMLLHQLTDLVSVDGPLVTVQAGMPLWKLNELLAQHGLAMPNLGDIDAQTISGAISTGTHGTGENHCTLATCVEAVKLVTAAGEVLEVGKNDEIFPAVRLGLGALGILVEVTLRCVPAFTLLADERPMALTDVLAGLDEWIPSNEHVEFYWYPYTDRAQLKRNNKVAENDRPLSGFRGWMDDEFLANTVWQGVCNLGRRVPAIVPTVQSIAARALTARTYTERSDRVFCTPRRVHFTEMEYEIPREALPEVLDALPRIIDGLPFKVQFPVEVRFTGPDDVWLSHGYGRESAYVAVHQFTGAPYEPYFRAFEAVCRPLGGRPHWGKLHYRTAEDLRPVYPKFDDFVAVRDRIDPARVFTNDYLDRVLGA